MKKILAVFDGFKLCQGTLRYAIAIARLHQAQLTGVFLDAFYYRNYSLSKVIKTSAHPELTMKQLDEADEQQRLASVREFEEACQQAGVAHTIHRDHSIPLFELQYESMYADLVIINEREKFTNADRQEPTGFIKDFLSSLQSPVLVVPDNYIPIEKIVLLYDGEPSSLYAIKMFSYVLEGWRDIPIEVVTVDEQYIDGAEIPGSQLMTDLMNNKFAQVTFTLLQGHVEAAIIKHLQADQHQLVVLGAYRRNGFSRWLKRSMADALMISLDKPLFIAHLGK